MMNENYDTSNTNNIDNNKCNTQYESEKLDQRTVEHKSSEILKNADCDSDTYNQILKNSNEEIDQENSTCKDKTYYLDHDTDTASSKVVTASTNEFNKTENVHRSDESNNNIFDKLSRIIDSDSEEENLYTLKSNGKKFVSVAIEDDMSKTSDDNISTKHLSNKNTMNSGNDSDNEDTIFSNRKRTNNIKNRYQTLIDSESDEEGEDNKELSSSAGHNHKEKKNRKEKNSVPKVSLKVVKEGAMRQIQSETQRLVRQMEISLPYHKPKQRTLQEFLSRKKVITALPKAPTMAAKLKMSSAIVDEVLKEKEKEAEIFYKSSDSEEEMIEISKETKNLECMDIKHIQNLKENNISRSLMTDNNVIITKNNEEKNNTSIRNESLIEVNNIEQNLTNAMVIETHSESSNIESSDFKSKATEIITNEKVDNSLQTDINENENKENVCTDNNRYDSKITNEHLNICTSKINNDYANIIKKSLGTTINENDEYNEYGLPPPKFDELPHISQKKVLFDIKSSKPKLKGIPGTVIDLTDDVKPSKKGITALIDRFVCKHSKTNVHEDSTPQVTATHVKESPNELLIVKEILPYKLPTMVNEDLELNRPGAKLIRLKEELRHKMALKRNEEWKQREQGEEWNESMSEEDNFNELHSSTESYQSESDDIENNVYAKKQKKRKKCTFIDDEAEVSGNSDEDEYEDEHEREDEDEHEDEDEDKDKDEDEDEDLNEDKGKDGGEDEDEDKVQKSAEDKKRGLDLEEENENSTCTNINSPTKYKTFRRIMKSLEDDSTSSVIENDKNNMNQTTSSDIFSKNFKENQLSDNDSSIPNFQANVVEDDSKYQINQTSQIESNTFNFVSPTTQLTALNVNLGEEKESMIEGKPLFINEADSCLIGRTQSRELSQQLRDFKQQTMFTDRVDILDKELTEIHLAKFSENKLGFKFSKESSVSESQLLELCSGTFSSQINDGAELADIASGIFQTTQVSNEKDSLCNKIEDKTDKQQSKEETTPWNKLRILSSDEEDSLENEINQQSKKRVKKLYLSDDEEEENNSVLSSNNELEEDEDEKFIDYDSEENEVVVPKKDIKRYAAKFLEEEAELSESDCDVSADEDEEELDKLELEDADDEEIDEIQVKDQLGKLHMRQLLDEDQKEVRMLQELLFEDGDLFSESARERKFKWRNIDKQDDNSEAQPLEEKDGWVDLSDDEDEAKWRKIREERDKFLAEKMKNIDTAIEDDINSSEICNFGLKVLKKRRINEFQKQNTVVEGHDFKAELKMPLTIAEMLNTSELDGTSRIIHNVMQKRSFLAKGEQTLARLAVLARQKETSLSSTNTKAFVFAPIDVTTKDKNTVNVETELKPKPKPKRKR